MSLEKYKFTEEHEWVLVEDDVATIGITEYATNELGEIVYVETPEINAAVNQSEEFGSVESVKSVSSLYSPVSGTVAEVNNELTETPELINESNYQNGWIIKVKLSDSIEVDELLTEQEYNNHLEALKNDDQEEEE